MKDYKPPTGIDNYPQRVSTEDGLCKGDICNREGCDGIIDEHEKEGCCSCHINPPCSYCTTDTAYCPKCNWEPSEEELPVIDKEQEERNRVYYQKQNEQWEKQRKLFYNKYRGSEPKTQLEMRTESHTHFSQKVLGVFPEGTETISSLLPKVRGTFGGRFTHFGKQSFEYIAYTD